MIQGMCFKVDSGHVYLNSHYKLFFSITVYHSLGISQVIFVSKDKSKETMQSKLENTVEQY